nr:Os02g0703700 [Ipomoea batatas]
MTLAVVSRAAKMTPMMLSAIWSSVRLSLAPMKDPSKSLWVSPFWRRVERIWARICASSRRAFMALWNRVPGSRPSSDSRVAFAMVSTSGTMALMASGMNARSTSFLSLAWPAQSAGWEREFDGTERDEFEDTTEEKNGEKRS